MQVIQSMRILNPDLVATDTTTRMLYARIVIIVTNVIGTVLFNLMSPLIMIILLNRETLAFYWLSEVLVVFMALVCAIIHHLSSRVLVVHANFNLLLYIDGLGFITIGLVIDLLKFLAIFFHQRRGNAGWHVSLAPLRRFICLLIFFKAGSRNCTLLLEG